MGRIGASGTYRLSLAAAVDGSEDPDAILAEACDATNGDAPAIAYFRGGFREAGLTLGTGHTIESVREVLRGKGIVMRKATNP